jgi:dTMP kinase
MTFCVIEGCDGAGTTTASKLVAESLAKEGIPVVFTFEPSDGPIGSLARKALQHKIEIDFRGMLGLFLADRWWHIDNVIKPALAQGQIVICDRYHLSTWVYQQDVFSRSIIEELQKDLLVPDLVYLLDLPVEVAKARKKGHGEEKYDALERQRVYRTRYLDASLTNSGYRLGKEEVFCLDSQFMSASYNAEKIIHDIKERRKS